MLLVLKLILILIHNMFLDHTIPILINLKKSQGRREVENRRK